MTSDDLFWRLMLAMRTVEEAALLWRLAAVRADEYAYRISNRAVSRHLGNTVTRQTLDRTARRLVDAGLVTVRFVRAAYTEYRLDGAGLGRLAKSSELGQNEPVQFRATLAHFDPFDTAVRYALPTATFASRLAMLLRGRDEALMFVWLHQAGADGSPLRVSSRDLGPLLLGLIDRRTAMRAMDRLASAGLVSVTPMARAGTEYSINCSSVQALLHQPFPFPEDAAATMPGWANLHFPLLHRLAQAVSAETTPADNDAAMEV